MEQQAEQQVDLREYHTIDGQKLRVYAIPERNLPTFQDKLGKLAKRAVKLGMPVPSYTVLRQEYKTVDVVHDYTDELGVSKRVVNQVLVKYLFLVVQNPRVVVSGWEFLAKLEHTSEGNILHTLPGKTAPLQYRDAPATCDHCKVNRRRNDTFILYQDGSYMQVGRNCLADFLGKDAERYADAAELYATVDELAGSMEDYSGEGGGWGPRYEVLDWYLSYVAEVIAHVGWKSRSSARDFGGQSTSDIAQFHMHSPKSAKKDDLLFTDPTDKSTEVAKEAIQWAEELSDLEVENSEYLHNLRVIARLGVVGSKQFGYAASMVSSYQKHLGQLEVRMRRQSLPSNWVGEEGDKRILTLLVEKVVQLDSAYGISKLHLMSDENGNAFTWYSHGEVLDTGTTHTVKATIKKHTEYKGTKQTVLLRVSKVEMKNYTATVNGLTYYVMGEDDKAARKALGLELGTGKVPRGTVITQVESPMEEVQ